MKAPSADRRAVFIRDHLWLDSIVEPVRLIADDLAPGDGRGLEVDWGALRIERVRSPEHPLFARLYDRLWAEFGPRGEMEKREVIAQRLGWDPRRPINHHALRYEMLAVLHGDELVGLRDHTAIVPAPPHRAAQPGQVIVHLSHVIVEPPLRGGGLSAWLRAFPLQTARECASAAGETAIDRITLVAEMEHPDGVTPMVMARLRSYERAGFLMLDPDAVRYMQPDFRPPQAITSSSMQPVPLALVVRRVGREAERTVTGAEVRAVIEALYTMFAVHVRADHMAPLWALLDHLPGPGETVELRPPLSASDEPLVAQHSLRGGGMITTYYDPGYAAPIGDTHVMPITKFSMVADGLRDSPGVRLEAPRPLSEEDLLRVHTPEYVAAVRSGEPRALAESQKFPWSPALYPSVRLTGGGCLAAARRALRDGVAAALVSGFHHAHADHGEGFCTFNGLVVTADRLRADDAIRRLAVVDLDLHYGNGTASLAPARPHLFTLSIYGNDYHQNQPFTDVSVVRHSDGPNHQSIALPNGSGRAELFAAMEDGLARLLAWGRPDLVLYQAGADPYREDPYSPLALDHDDLRERDRRVFDWARRERLPIAWVLAGGYTKDTSKIVRVHLNTFDAAREVFG